MQEQFSRTRLLIGSDAIERLAACRVIVFGVGGVGGYVVEALARSGVGAIDVVDDDRVALSNLNRQVIALHSTLGQHKVDVIKRRVSDINPRCKVNGFKMFYLPDNADSIDLTRYDYVIDCIDTVSAKMELARRCKRLGIRHICSMGAAYKLDATRLRVADFSDTTMDPLARIMRKKLRKEGITGFKCVFSDEKPRLPVETPQSNDGKKMPASNAWVPAAMGLIIGGEVIKDLTADLLT